MTFGALIESPGFSAVAGNGGSACLGDLVLSGVQAVGIQPLIGMNGATGFVILRERRVSIFIRVRHTL